MNQGKHHVPTVGRDVIYMSYGTPGGEHTSRPIAAKITQVETEGNPDSNVKAVVFNPSGIFFTELLPVYRPDEEQYGTPGTLGWPKFVSPKAPSEYTSLR